MTTEMMFAEIEFWGERTGREVLLAAVKAAERLVIAESIHVLTPSVLSERGADWGECELWFSIGLAPGATVHDFWTEVRGAGIRVKTAGPVPAEVARAPWDDFMEWLCAD